MSYTQVPGFIAPVTVSVNSMEKVPAGPSVTLATKSTYESSLKLAFNLPLKL